MSEFLVCPHCGSSVVGIREFYNGIGQVKIGVDGRPKFYFQNKADKPSFEVCVCMSCHKELELEELVEGVKCSKCGRDTTASDLDENGVCSICRLEEENPEFGDISIDELKRRYFMLSHGSSITEKMTKKAEKAPKVVQEDTNNSEPEEKPAEEQEKPVKKRRVRRKTKGSEDLPEETKKDTVEEQNQVAEQQEAPWPTNAGNPFGFEEQQNDTQREEQAPQEEVMIGMYDDSEDAI